KNMVAGVGGIDAVLLIIAADEGVMPQTREHLDICKILSIKQGIVALTKTDMVDDELLELAVEDVREFVQGSFLEDAPMVPVSSTTGAGIDSLKVELEKLIDGSSERPAAGLFRLPIDRVFSMKGFGTVITGTLMAGSVAEGDEVDILPKKIRAKIRGVQVHGQGALQAEAGQRTALNFQGLDKVEIQRGDVVCRAEMLMPTATVLAWFEYLAGAAKPLKNRARIRFH
ncbi:MAG: selenocysteine-specific translation factor, partial [Deltaproteobacteria bacterium]|nr:selenocysteine-specific translation factor [Deltaproteobacteria bacterium]